MSKPVEKGSHNFIQYLPDTWDLDDSPTRASNVIWPRRAASPESQADGKPVMPFAAGKWAVVEVVFGCAADLGIALVVR